MNDVRKISGSIQPQLDIEKRKEKRKEEKKIVRRHRRRFFSSPSKEEHEEEEDNKMVRPSVVIFLLSLPFSSASPSNEHNVGEHARHRPVIIIAFAVARCLFVRSLSFFFFTSHLKKKQEVRDLMVCQ